MTFGQVDKYETVSVLGHRQGLVLLVSLYFKYSNLWESIYLASKPENVLLPDLLCPSDICERHVWSLYIFIKTSTCPTIIPHLYHGMTWHGMTIMYIILCMGAFYTLSPKSLPMRYLTAFTVDCGSEVFDRLLFGMMIVSPVTLH